MSEINELMTRQLYNSLKTIIVAIPQCPDGSRGIACPSCLAKAIASALNDPSGTPMEAVAGDIPIFTAKDVQSLMNAAVNIDRQECTHETCTRNTNSSVLMIPV